MNPTTQKKSQKKQVAAKKKKDVEEVYTDKDYAAGVAKKEKSEKKSDTYFFLTVGIVVLALIILIAGAVFLKRHAQDKDAYNHFKFSKPGLFWETAIERDGMITFVPFYFHPRDLESIPIEPGVQNKILNFTKNGTIIITLDPNLNSTMVQAGVQISRLTGERYGVLGFTTRSAITNLPEGMNASQNLTVPIINCDQANETLLVIRLTVGTIQGIGSRGNCIIVEGRNEDEVLRAAEKLDYLLLGIME
jgi:hypothetical protein